MRLGIVGKGGTGKTSVSALLAAAYAERGDRVLAIDTDSNPNLGLSLGLAIDEVDAMPQLPPSLIVGTEAGSSASELVAEYGRSTPAGATLLSAIRVSEAGAGCTCSGHATVRSFLHDTLDTESDLTLVDMEAGLEHLSRSGGTLAYADVLLVVMDPSRKSVLTAARTVALAAELGLPHVYGLGNKAADAEDVAFFERTAAAHDVPMAGVLPLDPEIARADRAGERVRPGPELAVALQRLLGRLDELAGTLVAA